MRILRQRPAHVEVLWNFVGNLMVRSFQAESVAPFDLLRLLARAFRSRVKICFRAVGVVMVFVPLAKPTTSWILASSDYKSSGSLVGRGGKYCPQINAFMKAPEGIGKDRVVATGVQVFLKF